MANNDFTAVLPVAFAGALKTLRASNLATSLVNRDYDTTPANQGDTVNVTVAAPSRVYDVNPGKDPVDADGDKPTSIQIPLEFWKETRMKITDKEVGMIASGVIPAQISADVAFLVTEVNKYIWSKAKGFYTVVGAPGTEPFADTNAARLGVAALNRALSPMEERYGVLGVAAHMSALGRPEFTNWNVRGDAAALKTGQLSGLYGVDWRMDQGVPTHVAGTPGAGTKSNGIQAAGSKTVNLKGITVGQGLVEGDIITFAGNTQTYVIGATALADGSGNAAGIAVSPALVADVADATSVTVLGDREISPLYHRSAIAFTSRPLTTLSDGSLNAKQLTDPQTGITLRMEFVRQNRQTLLLTDILCGAKLLRPELGVQLVS